MPLAILQNNVQIYDQSYEMVMGNRWQNGLFSCNKYSTAGW